MRKNCVTLITALLLSLTACVDVVGDGEDVDTASQASEVVAPEGAAANDSSVDSSSSAPNGTPNPRPTQPAPPPMPPPGGGGGCMVRAC
jgi:hypothetical protein